MTTDTDSWFPLFEFQDWFYQSFLVLPTVVLQRFERAIESILW